MRIATDTPSELTRSNLRVFENGSPLGPPHSQPPRLGSGPLPVRGDSAFEVKCAGFRYEMEREGAARSNKPRVKQFSTHTIKGS